MYKACDLWMLLQYFILVHTHNEYNYPLHQPDKLCGSHVCFNESHFNTKHTHTVHKCYNNLVLHTYYIHANILDVLLACAVGAAHASECYCSSSYKRCILLSLLVMYAGLSCMETLVPAVCTMCDVMWCDVCVCVCSCMTHAVYLTWPCQQHHTSSLVSG